MDCGKMDSDRVKVDRGAFVFPQRKESRLLQYSTVLHCSRLDRLQHRIAM